MSRVFWNVIQCSRVEEYKAFRRAILTPLSESKKSPVTKKKLDAYLTNLLILIMVAVHSGELPIKFYQTTRQYILTSITSPLPFILIPFFRVT